MDFRFSREKRQNCIITNTIMLELLVIWTWLENQFLK